MPAEQGDPPTTPSVRTPTGRSSGSIRRPTLHARHRWSRLTDHRSPITGSRGNTDARRRLHRARTTASCSRRPSTTTSVATPGRVVVDVRAAGVNYVDALFVAGPVPDQATRCRSCRAARSPAWSARSATASPRSRPVTACWCRAASVATPSRWVAGAGQVTRIPDGLGLRAGRHVHPELLHRALRPARPGRDDAGRVAARARRGRRRRPGHHRRRRGPRPRRDRCRLDPGQARGRHSPWAPRAVIDTSTEDVKVRARELTDGAGVDLVLDPVGGDLAEPAAAGARLPRPLRGDRVRRRARSPACP